MKSLTIFALFQAMLPIFTIPLPKNYVMPLFFIFHGKTRFYLISHGESFLKNVTQNQEDRESGQQGLRDNVKYYPYRIQFQITFKQTIQNQISSNFRCEKEKMKDSLAWKNLMQKTFWREEIWALKIGGAREKSPM